MSSVKPVVYDNLRVRGEPRWTQVREGVPGSPEYAFSTDSGRCARHYYVNWHTNDPGFVWQVAKDFLGYSEVKVDGYGNKYISRVIPHDHPHFPNYFYADSISRISGDIPIGRDSGKVAVYDEAHVTVSYSAPMHKVLTDAELMTAAGSSWPDESSLRRYVVFQTRPSGYYQTLPFANALYWVSDTGPYEPVTNKVVTLLPEGDLAVMWHQIPWTAVPWTAIYDLMGKCNEGTFGYSGSMIGVIGAQKLVCLAPEINPIRLVNGEYGANIVYRFKHFPNGANHFYYFRRGTAGSWRQTSYTGQANGDKLYPPGDFRRLFRPEP